jgi:cardiolipin synthase
MLRPVFLATVALLALARCAPTPVPPGLDAAVLEANRGAQSGKQPTDSIALMRRQGELYARQPFVSGNRVELLVNGPATFSAMRDLIAAARVRIDMESYEFDDQAGGQFADLLIAARTRGVAVNLVYDGWGALTTKSVIFDRLRAAGAEVLEYNPIRPNGRVPIDLNRRDHRKLLCGDGKICIMGGVNISKVYQNAPAPRGTDPDDQAWRDTDVLIEGPVVAQLEHFFSETWREQHGRPLPPAPPPPTAPAGTLLVQAIDGAPEDGQPLIYRTLLASIALSQRSVHLTTGFFVPTPDMRHALEAAARRGVDVQLIVPGDSDSDMALWAGRAQYGGLLDAGVHIHELQGRILHAKTSVIDGAWSAVGSANLDWRSAIWNNEIDAIVLGTVFGSQMEILFSSDLAHAHTIDRQIWERRGPLQRFRELRASVLSRLL